VRVFLTVLLLAAAALLCAAESDSPKRYRFTDSPFDIPAETSTDKPTLMFAGDIKLEGRTAQQIARNGVDYPFKLVADELRSADLCFGNCETAITDYAKPSPGKPLEAVKAGKAFIFKSDPKTSGKVLADAGLDIVQLANNHAMDYCADGLLDTFEALGAADIAYVGAGNDYASAIQPRIVDVQGARIGFLAYSMIVPPYSAAKKDAPGINYLSTNFGPQLRRDISALREQADLAIVCIHWGQEGSSVPSNAQRKIAHTAVDAGADLVIGTHTHTFQGVEHYKGGLIAYSLGNFVFTGKSKLLASGILKVNVERSSGELHFANASVLPCWIKDGVPTPSQEVGLRSQLNAVLNATGSRFGNADGDWLSVEPLT
jgi:poly-gamma-glutamate synthesis protein (capsule biosynthesis protein)